MGLIAALSSFSSSLILTTKLFLFEVVPSFYLQIFTPLHLFFLLNLLIISILAITHLCKDAASPSLAAPHSSTSSSDRQLRRLRASCKDRNQAKLFAGIKLGDHDPAADRFMAHEAEISAQMPAAKSPTALRSDHLRRRRADRLVNEASPPDNVHSDETSAEILPAQPANVYNAVLSSSSRSANDPDMHDQCNSKGVISVKAARQSDKNADCAAPGSKKLNKQGNLHDNQAAIKDVIRDIRMGRRAEMDEQTADFYTGRKHEEGSEEGAAHGDEMDHDHGLISSLDPVLKSAMEEQERPLASTRFTSKKTNSKTHLEMVRSHSPLKISRPTVRRGDTIDATWKAICENKLRHLSPLSRQHKTNHTKKIDHRTDTHSTEDNNVSEEHPLSPLSPSKKRHHMPIRKREHSIPRDELNARVESFITRFNQQIRIQREESLLNYTNMATRGAN